MKTLEELKQLKDELILAYNSVLTSETEYDQSTVLYAAQCMNDAVKAFRLKVIENEDDLIERLNNPKIDPVKLEKLAEMSLEIELQEET
jgi:hypothetical protein